LARLEASKSSERDSQLAAQTPAPSSPASSSSRPQLDSYIFCAMFKATMAVLSKASRAPLTSKSGNKEFYKGELLPLWTTYRSSS